MKPNRERFFVFSLLVILTHFHCKLNPFSGELSNCNSVSERIVFNTCSA